MTKVFTINVDTLDTVVNKNDVKPIYNQGDVNTSILNINVTQKEMPYDLTGATVSVYFEKDDSTIVYQDSTTGLTVTDAINGKISVTLNTQTLSFPGKVLGAIKITTGTATIETKSFYIYVQKSLTNNNSIKSANYIDSLIGQPNEAEWTATAGQLTYVLPNNQTYDPNSKWLSVYVGGAPIPASQVQKDNQTQFTLLIDPSIVLDGMKVFATWVQSYVPTTSGHHSTHEKGGYDEIDIVNLKNFNEQVVTPLAQIVTQISKYNADGTGATDSSAAFQNAINDCAGKSVIWLGQNKTYLINTTLNLKTGTWFKGKNVTLVLGTGSNAKMFVADSACTGDILFNGITFTGNDTVPDTMANNNTVGHRMFFQAIFTYGTSVASGFTVKNCKFTNLAGWALFVMGCSQVTIENNQFINLYNSIQVTSGGDYTNYQNRTIYDIKTSENYFYNCSTGVVYQGLSDATIGAYKPAGWIKNAVISDNHFERISVIVLEFYGMVDGGYIERNYATRCTASGVTTPVISVKLSRNCTVKNNYLPFFGVQGDNTDVIIDPNTGTPTSNPYTEFNLDNVDIAGNIIIGDPSASGQINGILIWRQATNVRIHDNIISNCYSGITIGMTSSDITNYPNETQASVQVFSNTSHDNTYAGMLVYTLSYGTIDSNRIYNNGNTSDNSGQGIRINQSADNCEFVGNRIVDTNTGANRKQATGLYVNSGITLTNFVIRDNYINNNKNANIYNPINTPVIGRDFIYHYWYANATAGTQSSYAHGLGYTPTVITLTPAGNGNVYMSAPPDNTYIYITGTVTNLPFYAYYK